MLDNMYSNLHNSQTYWEWVVAIFLLGYLYLIGSMLSSGFPQRGKEAQFLLVLLLPPSSFCIASHRFDPLSSLRYLTSPAYHLKDLIPCHLSDIQHLQHILINHKDLIPCHLSDIQHIQDILIYHYNWSYISQISNISRISLLITIIDPIYLRYPTYPGYPY